MSRSQLAHAVLFVFVIAAFGGSLGLALAQEMPRADELLTLRWQNAALKQQLALAQAQAQICQGQLAPAAYRAAMDDIASEIATLRTTFEAEHPGWTLDDSGQPTKKGE